MYSPQEIFEAASTIRLELPKLVGAKAADLDQQLATLLNQDRTKTGLENQIAVLLAQEDATRDWMQAFLVKDNPERSLEPSLQDLSNLISLPKFACPHGDCTWYRHNLGEPIPPCPTHKIPLVRVRENLPDVSDTPTLRGGLSGFD